MSVVRHSKNLSQQGHTSILFETNSVLYIMSKFIVMHTKYHAIVNRHTGGGGCVFVSMFNHKVRNPTSIDRELLCPPYNNLAVM